MEPNNTPPRDESATGLKIYRNRGYFDGKYEERDMYAVSEVDALVEWLRHCLTTANDHIVKKNAALAAQAERIAQLEAEIRFHEETIRQNRAVMKSQCALAEIGRLEVAEYRAGCGTDRAAWVAATDAKMAAVQAWVAAEDGEKGEPR